MSFVNEIDDVVNILTVLLKFCYIFRTLSSSFYYTHYCKILLYRITYYIVNTQFSLVAASFLKINYLSIYLKAEILAVNLEGAIFEEQIKSYPKFGNFSSFFFCHGVEKGLLVKSETKRNNTHNINNNN